MAIEKGNIADIRKDYQLANLDEGVAGDDPLLFFKIWFGEAVTARVDEVNAMTLATISNNRPHARIVLLKGLEDGGFTFFTNYDSNKGRDIDTNPHVAAVFFWKELERQVRIEGVVHKVHTAESDKYFHSRPEGSQLGAWASPQSRIIPDRTVLDSNYANYKKEFGTNIPRPPHWGGYVIIPDSIEFWQGRQSRMHDRILFTLNNGKWEKSRLAP